MKSYTKESLVEKLTTISADCEKKIGELTVENIDQLEEMVSKAREDFLSEVFDGRSIFSLFTSEFCVYVDTWEDRTKVIEKVRAMGFKNIHTFEPLTCDGNGGSKKDPIGNFAVRVSSRESLIIGDHAEDFIRINKPFVDVVAKHVIHTYCHNGDYRLTFADEKVADILTEKMNKFLKEGEAKYRHKVKSAVNLSVTKSQQNLDNFVVAIALG